MGHHPHGRARLVADLLPAARHRLRRHHPGRAQARAVLALRASRDDRLGHRRHGHVLDRPQGRRTRADAADEAVAARTRAAPRVAITPASASPRWRSFRRPFRSPRSSWPAARSAVNPWTFFTTLAGVRARALPRRRQAWPPSTAAASSTWMQSTVFEVIVGTLIVLADRRHRRLGHRRGPQHAPPEAAGSAANPQILNLRMAATPP